MKNEINEVRNRAGQNVSVSRKTSLEEGQETAQDKRGTAGFDVSYDTDAGGVRDLVIKFTDERGEQCLHVPRPSFAAFVDLTKRLRELEGFMDRIDTGVVVYSPTSGSTK